MDENHPTSPEPPDQEPTIVAIELADMTVRSLPEFNAVELEIVDRDGSGFSVMIARAAVVDVVVALARARQTGRRGRREP